uniref:Phenylalanine--tRNA ligase n=1 Tax=Steinernema glaseri TaxID=37863 RepID=A0A1I7Y801_9BILA
MIAGGVHPSVQYKASYNYRIVCAPNKQSRHKAHETGFQLTPKNGIFHHYYLTTEALLLAPLNSYSHLSHGIDLSFRKATSRL